MYINHEAIARAERLAVARKALTAQILNLRNKGRIDIKQTLEGVGLLHVPGLATRLYNGRKLTPTQYYNVCNAPLLVA